MGTAVGHCPACSKGSKHVSSLFDVIFKVQCECRRPFKVERSPNLEGKIKLTIWTWDEFLSDEALKVLVTTLGVRFGVTAQHGRAE